MTTIIEITDLDGLHFWFPVRDFRRVVQRDDCYELLLDGESGSHEWFRIDRDTANHIIGQIQGKRKGYVGKV